jgi:hypothetical protein
MKKIQLNDEQWRILQALRIAAARQIAGPSITTSSRLRSNGLIGTDRQGRVFLTDLGRSRLNQGR